jgi:phage gp36-like protein
MALTTDQVVALDLGYLKGSDLIQYCSPTLLIKQNEVNADLIQNGCDQAYQDIKSWFSNRYDIDSEFENEGADREALLVKLVTLKAIENILGNLTDLTTRTKDLIIWANDTILAIRNRQRHLDLTVASDAVVSDSALIDQSFNKLG